MKCNECQNKIKYNDYKKYKGKILCGNCYRKIKENKKAKKVNTEEDKNFSMGYNLKEE